MPVALIAHPATGCAAVDRIDVDVVMGEEELHLRYALHGRLDAIVVPGPTAPARVDELWKATCFEAFFRGAEGTAYIEFNFAPSTQWAAYQFDDTRQGMRDATLSGAPHIAVRVAPERLVVDVTLSRHDLPRAACSVGLTAVIEEVGGHLSYWALAHPSQRPDFHHPDGFVLALPARG